MKKENNTKHITISSNHRKQNYKIFDRLAYSHRIRYYDNVPPHWHDFHELEFVMGKGSTTIDGTTYEFEHGAISFLTPTSIHSYLFEEKEFDCCNFNIDIRYLESKTLISFISQTESSFLALSEEDISWYLRMISEFEDAWNKKMQFSRKLYAMTILEFLIVNMIMNGTADSLSSASNPKRVSSPIQNAVLFIQKNFRDDLKIKDVADSVWLSEKYFSRLFHQVMGCTFSKYLTDIRLKNACHMLIYANDTVSDIAYDSGFKSEKHFFHQFKKHYGMTPLEYRKNYTSQ